MVTPPDEPTADPDAVIAALRQQLAECSVARDTALTREAALSATLATHTAELTERKTEFDERIEHQAATIDVLRAMSASPDDAQPVFDLIVRRAQELCNGAVAALWEYDGQLVHFRSEHGILQHIAPDVLQAYKIQFPMAPTPTLNSHRALLQKRIIHVRDTDAEPDAARALGWGSEVHVPLLRGGESVGALALASTQKGGFSDTQIELLKTFAEQAVIAITSAETYRALQGRTSDLQEALEQQTATAEVLQAINSSPGDLQPVFDVILERALDLCEAKCGNITIYDGEVFNFVATIGHAEFGEWIRQHGQARPGPGTTMERMIRGEQVVHIPDIADDDVYRTGSPVRKALVEIGGFHTFLGVAFRKDDALLGILHVYRQEVRPFSKRQIALLENFAAQAVIAMENARLLDELRQRQEELRVTFENMGDGVAMFDGTQHLAAWNAKFQEIFDLPDVLLKQHRTYEEHLRFLAARGDFGTGVDTTDQIHELIATTGQPYGYERTRPDGRVIEIRRNPVPDGGFVLIFSDITERKRSEAEIRAARDAAEAAYRDLKAAQASLIQAEKMASLGQLTAGIAHEIKNPLNFVNNFAELSGDLLDELHDAVASNQEAEIDELTATLKGNLAKIAEHGKRADGIVRSMLEHSRGSSGERRSVSMNTLVDEALNLAYHGARAQDQSFNVTLQRDFGDSIAPITLVPQDVTRVLLNLCSNGFYAARRRQSTEATPGFEPMLKVATRELGDAVEIRVRDNGIGIPEEVKNKLFHPFFTTKPTGEGTGLGLSISYDIVTQQHGGSITVDSKTGEYSEFTIRLPRNP